jgi:DNA-binding beta-propeller fold protein YncE
MSSLFKGKLSLVLVCLCAVPLPASIALGQTVIATIPVAGYAGQGAVDPEAQKVYMPVDSPGVIVIDEKTNTVTGTITLDTQWGAVSVALNPNNGLLYIGAQSGGLFVVNPKTHATVGFINVNAVSVAVNPRTNKVYASDFNSTLYVIDAETNNIDRTIAINGIQNIALNPFTDRVYAAIQYIPGQVAVVNGKNDEIVAEPAAGSGLSFVVSVDPGRDLFYSTEQFGTLTVYDGKTNTKVKSVAIPGQPVGLSLDPITRDLYVSNYGTNELDIIDGATYATKGTVALTAPMYSTDDPFHKLLYVGTQSTDANGNTVATISVVKTQ